MRLVTPILFLFWLPIAFGQLSTPIKGGEYSSTRKENFNGFLGQNSTTLFTVDYLYISRKKQELIIRKFYLNDLKLVDSQNIYEIPPDGFYGEPIEVYYVNDTIYLFNNLYSEDQKVMYITMEVFDVNCQKISSTSVDTLADDESIHIEPEKDNRGFVLIRSNKFSNLTEQEIAVKYVNHESTVLWNDMVRSPMALQNLTIEKIEYAQGGPLYVLCNYNFDSGAASLTEDRSLLSNYKYAVWAYDHNQHFLKEFEIRMKGKWINGVRMELNNRNQLLLAGYFNESRYYTISGAFSLLIGPHLNILKSTYFVFTEDILKKFLEEKEREKTKELEDYQLNELQLMNNGSYFLLGERYYKYIERNYDPRTNITTTTEHYNYNSIIVSYFDSLGNHQWTDRIPKFQNSTNDFGYFSSFATLNTQEELYLFFNDSDKNNDLALNDYFNYKGLFNNRHFQVTGVRIDTSGLVSRNVVLNTDNSYILRAKESNQISEDTMYLFTELGRDAKVFSVSLKKN